MLQVFLLGSQAHVCNFWGGRLKVGNSSLFNPSLDSRQHVTSHILHEEQQLHVADQLAGAEP